MCASFPFLGRLTDAKQSAEDAPLILLNTAFGYSESFGGEQKKLYILAFVIIAFFLCTGIAFSDNRKGESGKGNRNTSEYNQRYSDKKAHTDDLGYKPNENSYKPEDRGHKSEARGYRKKMKVKVKDSYRHSDANKRRDYQKYYGYRERPYDRDRHYAHHNHKGHRYEYHGHWWSWDQWERYKKEHPDVYREGNYYRENAHLMF